MKLRIAVADDEPRMGQFYQECLTALGHEVVLVARTGAELVVGCDKTKPQLVITDIKMPDMDGLDAAEIIWRELAIPVILVSAYSDAEYLERADAHHVMAFLVKPIKREDLPPAILIASKRFAEFEALRAEATDLRQALHDRKIIERAKGALMKWAGLDEPAAFRRLQHMARNQNRKLVQVAEMILAADTAFSMPDDSEREAAP
jgi:AmiR/NasT family two-component response regulator